MTSTDEKKGEMKRRIIHNDDNSSHDASVSFNLELFICFYIQINH